MPRIAKRDTDGDRLMVAIDSACIVAPDGTQHDITAGMRLYASRPAVKAAPRLWVSADLDDLDLRAARMALLEEAGVFGRD